MSYFPERAKATASGDLKFCIYDGDGVCVFSHTSVRCTLVHAEMLEKENPNIKYTLKCEVIKED